MQVAPIKPKLKAPGSKRLKLRYDGPLSNFAFKFNLRRYSKEDDEWEDDDDDEEDDEDEEGGGGRGAGAGGFEDIMDRLLNKARLGALHRSALCTSL